MRKTGLICLIALIALPLVAQPQQPQLKFPRASQKASITQTIGLTDITITYARPGVKGRQIWGGLVPYDKVWRTGANEATTISLSDDVMINGQKLAKGTYSLHTIPGTDEWTIIFNTVADQWGSFSYDAAKDALRIKVKPEKAEYREWLTFDFPELSTDAAKIAIRWENVCVPFTVDTQATQKVVAAAKEAIANSKADDWMTPYRAANFAFDNKIDALASEWLDRSIKAKENMSNLWLKARMQQKAGDKAGAIKTGEIALSKMTDQDSKDFAGEIRKQIETWKK